METEAGQREGKRLGGEYSLHHVAITVHDVDRALDFYRRAFAFPERERSTAGMTSNRGAWFLVGTSELHLQERRGETKKTDQHFGVIAEDIEAIAARVRELGGLSEEAKALDGFSKRFFVYDLDGNRIELIER